MTHSQPVTADVVSTLWMKKVGADLIVDQMIRRAHGKDRTHRPDEKTRRKDYLPGLDGRRGRDVRTR